MEFDYLPDGEHGDPYKVNILDTPGHQDFAEDTYRTLTAVDSASSWSTQPRVWRPRPAS